MSEKFRKRELVLTDNSSQYPQHISFQFTQDKVDLLDKHKVGDEIKVHYNLRGRLWTSPQGEDKYFNTIEGWRIESISVSNNNNNNSSDSANSNFTPNSDDDLPF